MSAAFLWMPTKTRIMSLALAGACLLSSVAPGEPNETIEPDRSGELQRMVGDLAYQLKLVEQFDRPAAEARRRGLEQAIDRWNRSARSDKDFAVMQAWLVEAMQASLPGFQRGMPPAPKFASPRVTAREIRPQPEVAPEVKSVEPVEVVNKVQPPSPPRIVAQQTPRPADTLGTQIDSTTAIHAPSEVVAAPPAQSQRHFAARPVDLGDPFVDDTLAATPVRSVEPPVIARPAAIALPVPQDEVRVNKAELGARVRGYVRGLQRVEAKLVADPHMPAEQLLLVARELRQLAAQHEFVTLYLGSITAKGTSAAPVLPSPAEAKGMIAARLADLKRSVMTEGLFDEMFAEGEIETFDAIERMLEEI